MKRESGSITLEAAVFLTIFIFAYLAFMDLVQVGRAQMIFQYALNETVKELAQSTYILTKAGIVEKSVQTGQKAAAFQSRTEEMVGSVIDLANVLESGSGDVIQQVEVTGQNIESYFENSDELWNGIVSFVKNGAGNVVKTLLIEQICKGSLKKQLSAMSGGEMDSAAIHRYLQKLGLQNGLSDISFWGTSWFDKGREIDIVMTYRMKYNLGVLGTQEKTFKVRAKTAVW